MKTTSRPAPRGRPRNPSTDHAILAAAQRLLAERGYPRMSLDEVATAAGVTKPTIYLRFRSKADLATAAVAAIQAQEPPASSGDGRADLIAVLRHFQRGLLRPNGMALLGAVLAEERDTPELIARFRERLVAPRRAMVRAVLESARERGEIAAEADVDAVVNLLIGCYYARYLVGEPIPRDWPERVVGTVWSGIRRVTASASGERRSAAIPTRGSRRRSGA
ncbi:MAG: TetR/AcrR family transcriptional regulator [bacterium]